MKLNRKTKAKFFSTLFCIALFVAAFNYLLDMSVDGVVILRKSVSISSDGSISVTATLLNLTRKVRPVHIHPHDVCAPEDVPDLNLGPFSLATLSREDLQLKFHKQIIVAIDGGEYIVSEVLYEKH